MFAHYIQKAGVWWMLPILLLAWVALALTLERAWYFLCRWRRGRRDAALLAELFDDQGRATPDALDALAALERRPASVPLGPLVSFARAQRVDGLSVEDAGLRAGRAAAEVVDADRANLDVLAVIANLAGTLGLLGTVAGVSMSFEHLARSNPKGLALALSTAMYTTLGGIVLFLLATVAVFLYGRLADRCEERLERQLVSLREASGQPALRAAPARPVVERDITSLPGYPLLFATESA